MSFVEDDFSLVKIGQDQNLTRLELLLVSDYISQSIVHVSLQRSAALDVETAITIFELQDIAIVVKNVVFCYFSYVLLLEQVISYFDDVIAVVYVASDETVQIGLQSTNNFSFRYSDLEHDGF